MSTSCVVPARDGGFRDRHRGAGSDVALPGGLRW